MYSPRWKYLAVFATIWALTITGCATKSTGNAAAAVSTSVSGAGAPGSAPSVSSSPDVTTMVGGMSKQIYLPHMLAKQLGCYATAGVNVDLIDEPAGGDATTKMLAGQVQGVGGFYDHTIVLQRKGKAAESVISMLRNPGEVELCRADLKGTIKSTADFKGWALGITDTGSSTDFLTTKAGVDPSSTTRRGVAAGQTFLTAMKQKVNAYVATPKWIQTHNGAQGIANVMPSSYYAGVGKSAYAAVLDSEKTIFNPTGLMPSGGPATCLAVLSAFNPSVKGKTIDTGKTFTDEFVKAATTIG